MNFAGSMHTLSRSHTHTQPEHTSVSWFRGLFFLGHVLVEKKLKTLSGRGQYLLQDFLGNPEDIIVVCQPS